MEIDILFFISETKLRISSISLNSHIKLQIDMSSVGLHDGISNFDIYIYIYIYKVDDRSQ